MTLCSTLLIMNEAIKPLVFVPDSAPHKYLIGKKKIRSTDPKIKIIKSDLWATPQLFVCFCWGGLCSLYCIVY